MRVKHLLGDTPGRRRVFVAVPLVAVASFALYHWRGTPPPVPAIVPHVDLGLPSAPPVAMAADPQSDPPARAPHEPAVDRAMDASPAEPEDLVNPFSGVSREEEEALRTLQHTHAVMQQRLENLKVEVDVARQQQELTRVQQETDALLHPPRRTVPPLPSVPDARVMAISSQAAVVLFHGERIKTWPGSTLGPWRVDGVFPDGISVSHKNRRAFLPLSFATGDEP